MTVYLKGKDGRLDQVEENVKEVWAEDGLIHIKYEDHKWGIVSGVAYFTDEMEISKIEA